MKLLALLLLKISLAAQTTASDLQEICEHRLSSVVQTTRMNFEPNYFARLYAVRNVATMASGGATYALKLDTGKLINMEGVYDPVPTPDETFLTTIMYDQYDDSRNGPHYFWTRELLDRPAPDDGFSSWIAGNFVTSYAYPSLGWLPNAKTGKYTYRYLCDDDQGQIYFRNDYFLLKSGLSSSDMNNYNIADSPWIRACSNINSTMKLPMISKTGNQISFYNIQSGVTQIYDVDDYGSCRNPINLPFITGKTDFSFDGSKVAFHMGRMLEPAKWFQTADPARRLDVYVWDLKTHRLTRMTDVGVGNGYFPTFKKDGKLGFLMQKVTGGNRSYSYLIGDPEKAVSLDQFPDLRDKCNCRLDHFTELAAIGILKDQMCKSFSNAYALEAEATLPLTLTNQQCTKLVQNYWDGNKNKVIASIGTMAASVASRRQKVSADLKNISIEEILKACPGAPEPEVVVSKVVDSQTLQVSKNPEDRLKAECSKCHMGSTPSSNVKIDLGDIAHLATDLRKKMADQIKAGNMPPGGLNESERSTLATYLNGG